MPFSCKRVFPKTYKGSFDYHLPCKKIKRNHYVMIRDELHKVYAPERIDRNHIKLHFKDQEPLTFGWDEPMTIPIIDDEIYMLISIDEKNSAHLRDEVNADENITVWIDDETSFGADLLEDYKNKPIKRCMVRRIRWSNNCGAYKEKLQIVLYSLNPKFIQDRFITDPTMDNVNCNWY